tara:strand:+ start:2203 stop:2577 length:375 start_codon:yes stop_codon:yes gene_type:complete
MDNSICGTIAVIEDAKEYGENGFRKRLMVLIQSRGSRYDNYIPMEFIQDDCDIADDLSVGLEVTVRFRISGRKWTSPDGEDKYFCNLEVVDVVGEHEMQKASGPPMPPEQDSPDHYPSPGDEPF